MIELTSSQIKQIFPNASSDHLNEFEKQHSELFSKYVENVPFFLAQIGHESAGLSRLVENLNYSAQGLIKTWPTRFHNLVHARKFERNPELIANNVYANRMGNGSTASGDGWRFRGRGYIQLTGKDAYITVGNLIGVDLVNNPDFACDPKYALRVVCGVWSWKKLNGINDFVTVTRRINGGVHGLTDRQNWLRRIETIISNKSSSSSSSFDIFNIQRQLNMLGYREVGTIDGILGNRTRGAIIRFKTDNNMSGFSNIDDDLIKQLNLLTDNNLIKTIQTNIGTSCGTPDGIFGRMTRGCIENYKSNNNIQDSVVISDELLNSLGIKTNE